MHLKSSFKLNAYNLCTSRLPLHYNYVGINCVVYSIVIYKSRIRFVLHLWVSSSMICIPLLGVKLANDRRLITYLYCTLKIGFLWPNRNYQGRNSSVYLLNLESNALRQYYVSKWIINVFLMNKLKDGDVTLRRM